MTNYNERLDEILKDFLDATDYALEAPIEQADDAEWFERPYIEAKQALTSLIKELVAEAKPEEKEHHNGANPIEVVWETGYNEAAREFEQNLLKALEEV